MGDPTPIIEAHPDPATGGAPLASAGNMAGLVDDFTGYLSVERGASLNTISAYRRDLSLYTAFLLVRGRTSPDSITRDDVGAWVTALRAAGAAPRTIERRVACIKSFHRFLSARVSPSITRRHRCRCRASRTAFPTS